MNEPNAYKIEDPVLRTQLEAAANALVKAFGAVLVYVVGSAARNALRADSDIDLAFFSDRELHPYEVFAFAGELYDVFGRDVDLIDLRTSSTVFQSQVVTRGQLIYAESQLFMQQFEMRVYKAYAMLNEERYEVLDRIKEEGSVYG